MKNLRINFKETCAIREIELIFSAMEKAAKFGNYKAVLSFSKLLQKRLKQCEDFCFVQSEQQTGMSAKQREREGTKMTVNDYISRMLENNEENPQIIVIYDDNHNIYYFGKAAYAPLNCWFAFKNAHMVGNELRINDIREEENSSTEGKETKIGKSVYDVDVHTVNGWDTYQVNANFSCVAGYKAILRVNNETDSENAKTIDCIRIYKHGTDALLKEYVIG